MAKTKLIRFGVWIGIFIGLILLTIGILLVTNVITFNVTQNFFGWVIIVLGVYTILEPIILKALKIF